MHLPKNITRRFTSFPFAFFQLCSGVRLVPESYNEFKKILISECRKFGTLKLAQARTLIKIDVNKTRKIYDFLVTEGFIKKDT